MDHHEKEKRKRKEREKENGSSQRCSSDLTDMFS